MVLRVLGSISLTLKAKNSLSIYAQWHQIKKMGKHKTSLGSIAPSWPGPSLQRAALLLRPMLKAYPLLMLSRLFIFVCMVISFSLCTSEATMVPAIHLETAFIQLTIKIKQSSLPFSPALFPAF